MIPDKDSWLLPEGIEELLPEEAAYLENLRRLILRLFETWGYQLVITPMIDFIDSLLTGSGHDLDLQTFQFTDQISGKTLGLRADMTPQVARMDAHHFKRDWPARLCYVGTVLHTRGDPLEKTRSPMQIGAELYGHAGLESDVEVICLMLGMLAEAQLSDLHLDLGHVGIFRALSKQAKLSVAQESDLFGILQRKAKPELEEFLSGLSIKAELKAMILELPELNGDIRNFGNARATLADADGEVQQALDNLQAVADRLAKYLPELPISFDLSELRGYHYHTGIVFAAFVPTIGREIARGGRYDNIGAVFGRARPATGFSADLKRLALLSKQAAHQAQEASQRIFAPASEDASLSGMIQELRRQGFCVIEQLPGQQGNASDLGCTHCLTLNRQKWEVQPLPK